MTFELIEDLYRLPSCGIPYSKETLPLVGGHSVRLRPFVLGDDREVTIVSKSKDTYQIYTRILERLITEPKGADFSQLLLTDVLAIMYAIRLRSFGTDYPVTFQCFECELIQDGVYDLSLLEAKLADDPEDFPDGFQSDGLFCDLGKLKVTMHLPRLKDERAINATLRDMIKLKTLKDEVIDTPYVRRAQMIDEIEEPTPVTVGAQGEPVVRTVTPLAKFNKLMQMSYPDYDKLKKFIVSKECGLLTNSAKITCSNEECKAQNLLMLKIDPEFFRPTTHQ